MQQRDQQSDCGSLIGIRLTGNFKGGHRFFGLTQFCQRCAKPIVQFGIGGMQCAGFPPVATASGSCFNS